MFKCFITLNSEQIEKIHPTANNYWKNAIISFNLKQSTKLKIKQLMIILFLVLSTIKYINGEILCGLWNI